jgi:hypothetical protein
LATPVSASLQQLPNGKTVTPTDDIQKWLNCAGIFDKATYTTLADVLADSTTLLALMSSNNASDYLVRSTSWATASGLVPTMTSNTTPSGVVSASQENASSAYKAYKAFDNDNSTGWYVNDEVSTNQWIGYDFGTAVTVRRVKVRPQYYNYARLKNINIQYSDDGSVYSGNNEFLVPNADQDNEYILTDTGSHRYWRMFVSDDYGSTIGCAELQFYTCPETVGICDNSTAMTDIGANNYCANTLLDDATWCDAICNSTYFESVLNVKVPTMTGNTTPSGTCFASSVSGNNPNFYPYKAFSTSAYGCQTTSKILNFCGYIFDTAKVVKKVCVDVLTNNGGVMPQSIDIKGTNDTITVDAYGTVTSSPTWTTLVTKNSPSASNTILLSDNNTAYSASCVAFNYSSASASQFANVQFYGRQDI